MRGFTLLEVLVSMGIMVLIGTGIVAFQRNVITFSTFGAAALTARQETDTLLRRLSDEIKTASPSAGGAYALATATATQIVFYSDYDNDGVVERMNYVLNGTAIEKRVTEPVGIVYDSANESVSKVVYAVTNAAPIFDFYDKNYTGSATSVPLAYPFDIFAVRLIRITVTVDPNSGQLPGPFTISTQASMRNLKDNL